MSGINDGTYLTPADLAQRLRVSTKTLARWRALGYGPAAVRIGPGPRGQVRYLRTEVARFERERAAA